MAHLKNDAARTAAVAKLDQATDRCATTVNSKAKGNGKNKSKQAKQVALRVCLKSAV